MRRTGTGFIVSGFGYALTNKHVIESDDKVDEVEITGAISSREAFASHLIVVGTNQYDVALLKFADTSKAYKAVDIARSADVANVVPGTHLCSQGFPSDKEYFFTEGPMSGSGGERGFWLTQMTSNPGDSGAPVFLESGKIVAIKVGGYAGLQDVNALIPINLAKDLLGVVPDEALEKTVVSDGTPGGPKDPRLSRITVSSDAGKYQLTDFLKFLSGRELKVSMDSSAASDLERQNITIRTDGFQDVPLRWVLEEVLLRALPGGADQWAYDVVGNTVIVKRRAR